MTLFADAISWTEKATILIDTRFASESSMATAKLSFIWKLIGVRKEDQNVASQILVKIHLKMEN